MLKNRFTWEELLEQKYLALEILDDVFQGKLNAYYRDLTFFHPKRLENPMLDAVKQKKRDILEIYNSKKNEEFKSETKTRITYKEFNDKLKLRKKLDILYNISTKLQNLIDVPELRKFENLIEIFSVTPDIDSFFGENMNDFYIRKIEILKNCLFENTDLSLNEDNQNLDNTEPKQEDIIIITWGEIAKVTGLSERHLQRLKKAGKLKTFKTEYDKRAHAYLKDLEAFKIPKTL
jgi:hypothetical protein